jgi:hypothetical protein
MKYLCLLILASAFLAPSVVLDAQVARANKVVGKPCLAKVKQIKAKGKRWTAFAANQANKAGQACGWTMEFPVRETAISMALSECRASERDHPTWGKRGTCRIVFVQ